MRGLSGSTAYLLLPEPMINLHIQNFCGLQELTIEDEKPLSIVVGPNESGKTSIARSIEYVFTGAAAGCRGKDILELVHRGQNRMKVELELPGWNLARTKGTGIALKDVAARLGVDISALPAFFNASALEPQKGARPLKAFLDGLLEGPLTEPETIGGHPELAAAFQAAFQGCSGQPKDMIRYATDRRAKSQSPPAPQQPEQARLATGQLEQLRRGLQEAEKAHDAAQRTAREIAIELDLLKRCRGFVEAKEQHRVAVAKALDDPLYGRRVFLNHLRETKVEDFRALISDLEGAGYKETAGRFEACIVALADIVKETESQLEANPAPAGVGPEPALSPTTQTVFNALGDQAMGGISKAIQEAAGRLAKAEQDVQALERVAVYAKECFREGELSESLWEHYRLARERHFGEVSNSRTKWNEWDQLITRIETVESHRRAQGIESVLQRIENFGRRLLGGRQIVLSPDGDVFLGGMRYSLLSESTKWRVTVCLMAAIAETANSPILILDGADILDDANRAEIRTFLLEDIVPSFGHTLMLSTARGDENDRVAFCGDGTKWFLERGRLERIG